MLDVQGVTSKYTSTDLINNFKRIELLSIRAKSTRSTYHSFTIPIYNIEPNYSRYSPRKIHQIEHRRICSKFIASPGTYNHRAAVVRDTFNFPACIRVIIGSGAEKKKEKSKKRRKKEGNFVSWREYRLEGRGGASSVFFFFFPSNLPVKCRFRFTAAVNFFAAVCTRRGCKKYSCTREVRHGRECINTSARRESVASRLLLARKKRPANSRLVPAASTFPLYKVNYMADAR